MTTKTSRLNLRVSEELLAIMEEIGERKGLTISELVRDALDKYSDEEADAWNSGVVKVKLPLSALDDLEVLIMAGDATDLSQAINFALNEWIRDRKAYHIEGKEALRRKVEEIVEERAVREKLRSVARKMNER